jgi:hypothetical protein
MQRAFVFAFAAACSAIAFAAGAEELCLACEEPAASYRCSVEQPSNKYALGGDIEQEICSKVLANRGPHKKCKAVPVPEGGCVGPQRTVTVTDYQRALAATGESTYEVGALEIARRNVHDTWLCVTSMFKDC